MIAAPSTAAAEAALVMAAGIGAVLVIASLVGAGLKIRLARGRPHAVIDNLNARVRTWWVIAAVFGLAAAAGPVGITLLFAFAAWVALAEFVPREDTPRALRAAAFGVALPLQFVFVWQGWVAAATVFLPASAAMLLAWGKLGGSASRRIAALPWGLLLCVWSLSHIPALLRLDLPAQAPGNLLLVVFVVVLLQASDVLQYVWGQLFGRRRIAPSLSPGKTIEGTAGGLASATLLGAMLAWATPFSPVEAAATSALLVLLGFAGGLLFSAVKRRRGLKDWGTLVAGHGGMLDRIDSLCLPAPVFYWLLRWGWGA